MAIQEWSEHILVSKPGDDPQFSDEISSLTERVKNDPRDVVVDFSNVTFVNSSNIARLLRLRQTMQAENCHLILSHVRTQIWGVFLVTGLDQIFEFTNDVTTALTMLKIEEVCGLKTDILVMVQGDEPMDTPDMIKVVYLQMPLWLIHLL